MRKALESLAKVLWCAIFVAGLTFAAHHGWMSRVGYSYDPSRPAGLERLRIVAREGQPLISALDHYRQDHGNFPPSLSVLYSGYIQPFATNNYPPDAYWGLWGYAQQTRDGYLVYRKLNWDASLCYEQQTPIHAKWYYDPGDGGSETDLTAEFSKR